MSYSVLKENLGLLCLQAVRMEIIFKKEYGALLSSTTGLGLNEEDDRVRILVGKRLNSCPF